MIADLLMVAIGGALGAVCRFLVNIGAQALFGSFFPIGTLMVNVVGSTVIGFLSIFFVGRGHLHFDIMIMVGFLGAFTTFSSFSIETLHLFSNHHWFYGGLNILLNVALCLIGVYLGVVLASSYR